MRKILIVLLMLILIPYCKVNAEDINLESGKKVTGAYAGAEDYNYYSIKAASSTYIAITVKTTNKENLVFDICDDTKQVIAADISVPDKQTVYHKAVKGKTYYLRIKGVEGAGYTISYKMKDIPALKYAKKYNWTYKK